MSSVKAKRDFLLRVHASMMNNTWNHHEDWRSCECETAEEIRAANKRLPKEKRLV